MFTGAEKNAGFSLVELLITITILGLLAVTAIAMINPAETIRRVKDELRKTDINALLSSIDIYYISALQYPWGDYGMDFFAEITDPRVGVCDDQGVGSDGCLGYGNLITSANIKDVFANRDYFKAGARFDDKLYVISPPNDVPSVCYVPLARQTRRSWDDEGLDLRVLDFNQEDEIISSQSMLCANLDDEPRWSSPRSACFHCIPLKLGISEE